MNIDMDSYHVLRNVVVKAFYRPAWNLQDSLDQLTTPDPQAIAQCIIALSREEDVSGYDPVVREAAGAFVESVQRDSVWGR